MTLAEIKKTCEQKMLKSIALYRDGSKLSQPLSSLMPGADPLADALLAAKLGRPTATVFARDGEAASRTAEEELAGRLRAPADGGFGALGGGALRLSGSARGAVVCTGARTYFGSISQTLAGRRTATSFDRGVEQCVEASFQRSPLFGDVRHGAHTVRECRPWLARCRGRRMGR